MRMVEDVPHELMNDSETKGGGKIIHKQWRNAHEFACPQDLTKIQSQSQFKLQNFIPLFKSNNISLSQVNSRDYQPNPIKPPFRKYVYCLFQLEELLTTAFNMS